MEYKKILSYFRKKYPKCFTTPPSLLSIDIHKDLIVREDKLDTKIIREFLKIYCRKYEYRSLLKPGAARVDLDGVVTKEMTVEDITSISTPKKAQGVKAKRLKSDELFKAILSDKIAAKEFLEEYLPSKVKSLINLDEVHLENDSFIRDDLKKNFADIILSVKTKDKKDAFIYCLIEHQSSNDPLIALRLWKYTLLLLERFAVKRKMNKLPLVVPMLLYAGEDKFTSARNLWDLFEDSEAAKELLTSDYRLIDLQATPDDQITRKKHIALFEYIMKYIKIRDVLEIWRDVFENMQSSISLDKNQGYLYIKKLLWYSDAMLDENKQKDLAAIINNYLSETEGDKLMRTIADKYVEEGFEKGIEKGMEQKATAIAKNMLKLNLSINAVAKITGLSPEVLKKL